MSRLINSAQTRTKKYRFLHYAVDHHLNSRNVAVFIDDETKLIKLTVVNAETDRAIRGYEITVTREEYKNLSLSWFEDGALAANDAQATLNALRFVGYRD